MSTVEGTLPSEEWLCLEYPGIVENEEEALKTLDGGSVVAHAEESGEYLVPMVFQPDNPLSHSLYAGRTETNGLLLQITKKQFPDGQTEIHSIVKAKIPATYKFSGMSDFLFTPNGLPIEDQYMGSSDGMESRELDNLLSEDPRFSQEPLLNIPPLFSKLDCPIDSILKEKSSSVKSKKGYGSSARYAIPFSSPHVPRQREIPFETKEKSPALWTHLESFFEDRGIWSESMLIQNLPPEMPKETLLSILPLLCYRFRDGPWQKLWIVRDLDPRLDNSLRYYQSFVYTLPSNWYVKSIRSGLLARIRHKFQNHSIQQLNMFKSAPLTKRTLFQCCDLEDESIEKIVADEENCKGQCSATTGWFTNEAWSEIHSILQNNFQHILDQESGAHEQHPAQNEDTDAFPAEDLLSFLTDIPDDIERLEEESESEGDEGQMEDVEYAKDPDENN